MNQKGFVNVALMVFSVVVLAGMVGYITLIKKSAPSTGQQLITEPAAKTDIEFARETLTAYFDLLSGKQYSEAVKYHGSGYGYLQNWNPTIDSNDYAALIKDGCEINGLQCLKIKNILDQQRVSTTEFKFTVQFSNNDGTLFKQGPCCGLTEEQSPSKTDFEYTVRGANGGFLVMTQPVYVP